MLLHKECKANEIFVGNINIIELEKIKDKYKRLEIEYRIGNIAYDIKDRALKGNITKPLFISKKDFKKWDNLQMEELRKIRMG